MAHLSSKGGKEQGGLCSSAVGKKKLGVGDPLATEKEDDPSSD